MWKFAKTGVEGNCKLYGVNVFDYRWENTGKKIEVADPQYDQKHILNVYNLNLGNKTITFATGEFSNSVYGFYIKE